LLQRYHCYYKRVFQVAEIAVATVGKKYQIIPAKVDIAAKLDFDTAVAVKRAN